MQYLSHVTWEENEQQILNFPQNKYSLIVVSQTDTRDSTGTASPSWTAPFRYCSYSEKYSVTLCTEPWYCNKRTEIPVSGTAEFVINFCPLPFPPLSIIEWNRLAITNAANTPPNGEMVWIIRMIYDVLSLINTSLNCAPFPGPQYCSRPSQWSNDIKFYSMILLFSTWEGASGICYLRVSGLADINPSRHSRRFRATG